VTALLDRAGTLQQLLQGAPPARPDVRVQRPARQLQTAAYGLRQNREMTCQEAARRECLLMAVSVSPAACGDRLHPLRGGH
jgi:hypothetical protein